MEVAALWHYLTEALPGVAGAIKQRPEDFRVVELPMYEPCGSGEHIYFGVRKRGIPTPAAAGRIAKRLGVRPTDVAYAGLKDAAAIAEQAMSIHGLKGAQVSILKSFRDDKCRVLWVSRHTNKLRRGHLAGNRFAIRVRNVADDAAAKAKAVLDELIRRGAPNYFGPQRFGQRGDNWRLGAAAVMGDLPEFIKLLLGRPGQGDIPEVAVARQRFDAGDLEGALQAWPRRFANERRALAAWMRTRGKARPAFAAVDRFTRGLMISAFQSHLFNIVLDRRVDGVDSVELGDLAQKTDTGGVFTVTDLPADRERAERFEISATGPLVGYRVSLATGEPGAIERDVQKQFGLAPDSWRRAGAHRVKGMRRPLRFKLCDPSVSEGRDEHGAFVEVCFTAPAGCFATSVLREIMKTGEF